MFGTWRRAAAALPPPVSVVMPSLDQAAWLPAAVESVFAQGVDGLELVVVDGGSTDGSLDLLADLAERHPGLRWTSAPDGGPAEAVNRGVALARSAVIGWLNADDLYAPGALARALAHLAARPDDVMVYGEGEHVDAAGQAIARYPTRPPAEVLQAAVDGCPICQPTAVFRRDAFLALGGLDTGLRTAFDFDLWLRLFKAHPGRIGHVATLQARTRMHGATITTRLRQLVALEGLQVLHRHLGVAPPHWLLTHVDELCAQHPFHAEPRALGEACRQLLEAAAPWLSAADAEALRRRLDADRRLQLATPRLHATVHPDGWAGPTLDVRWWQPAAPLPSVLLRCRHAGPTGGPLRLRVSAPDGSVQAVEVRAPGPFDLLLAPPTVAPDARLIYRVRCEAGDFVPADCEPGSADRRRLAFQVEAIEFRPAY